MGWIFVIAGPVCAVIATIIAISLPSLIQQGNEIKELQQKINNSDFFKTAQFVFPVIYGQGNFTETVEKVTTQMITDCNIQFETEPVTTYTLLCRSFMNDMDKVCRQQYHNYCFGAAWKDFDLSKHVNPP